MYCTNCGKVLEPDYQFCSWCGAQVEVPLQHKTGLVGHDNNSGIPKFATMKPATSAILGMEPLENEYIMLKEKVYKSFNFSVHLNCSLILTNHRLIFIDREKTRYSFAILVDDLKTASIKKTFSDALLIKLSNGQKYEFSTNKNHYEDDHEIEIEYTQQWNRIMKVLNCI